MNEGHKFISLGYLVLPSLNKAFTYLLTYTGSPHTWYGRFIKADLLNKLYIYTKIRLLTNIGVARARLLFKVYCVGLFCDFPTCSFSVA